VLRSQALETPQKSFHELNARKSCKPALALHQSLCTKASQTFSGTFGAFSGTWLNLTRRLHQCTPELFWAEASISLRCWEMIYDQRDGDSGPK